MLGSYQAFDFDLNRWYNYINDGGGNDFRLLVRLPDSQLFVYFCLVHLDVPRRMEEAMKPFIVPPKFEAGVLIKAARALRRLAEHEEEEGNTVAAMMFRSRAEEFEEQAKHRIN